MAVAASVEEFAAALPPQGALIGLDLGSKTIGVAVSDVGRHIASPAALIARKQLKSDVAALKALIGERGAVGIVIGLPLNMDGSSGPRVQATRAFVRNIAPEIALPTVFWDERLSTAAVSRTLIEAGRSRARRAELVDKMAAGYILQGFLDRLGKVGRTVGQGDY